MGVFDLPDLGGWTQRTNGGLSAPGPARRTSLPQAGPIRLHPPTLKGHRPCGGADPPRGARMPKGVAPESTPALAQASRVLPPTARSPRAVDRRSIGFER